MSLKDITLGRYVYGESLLHSLDPRTKLLSLLLIMTTLFLGNGWQPVLLAGIYTVSACMLSGLHLSYLFRSILPFKWLIIITFLLNAIFAGGHILIEAPLPYGGITVEGLAMGGLFCSRIAILVLMASLLTLTTQPVVLVAGVEKLLGPFSKIGVNPHEIAIAMVITIRFIPVLLNEAVKIHKSHVARGLRVEYGLFERLKSMSLLILPLFASALKRAEDLAVAMECRLYRRTAKRTRYNDTHMTGRDWAALFISFVFAAGMVMM